MNPSSSDSDACRHAAAIDTGLSFRHTAACRFLSPRPFRPFIRYRRFAAAADASADARPFFRRRQIFSLLMLMPAGC